MEFDRLDRLGFGRIPAQGFDDGVIDEVLLLDPVEQVAAGSPGVQGDVLGGVGFPLEWDAGLLQVVAVGELNRAGTNSTWTARSAGPGVPSTQ